MLQHIMHIINKIISSILGAPVVHVMPMGPNTLGELLQQFDAPAKQKTAEQIITDYTVKEAMAKIELDLHAMDPSIEYRGCQSWYDQDKNKYFDFVPCVVRPEVVYCCYGKN